MAKLSAGLLLHRRNGTDLELLLVHPGGPFWAKKDAAAWSIPKGEYEPGEDPLEAARREFLEELGSAPPPAEPVALGEVRQSGAKRVTVWALEGDFDVAGLASNTFEMEWPPRSGRMQSFPEVDRAEWVGVELARTKLHKGQVPFVDRLLDALGTDGATPSP